MTFMLVSFVFLMTIESVFNGGFDFSVRILWIPIGILIAGFTWWCRHDFERILNSRWKAWVTAGLLYPIALLMSWPYVMALNALLPSNSSVTYEGPVTRKFISGGRRNSYQVVIRDRSTQKEVTLSTSESRYGELSPGNTIQETFSVGRLGIPFRWRHAKRKNQNLYGL